MDLGILTVTIAAIVAIITFGQWQSARMKLRYELFEKRYGVYEKITGFLASVAITGRVEAGAEVTLLQETKRAHFLFSGDADIKQLISRIYGNAVDLWALQAELENLNGDSRSQNIQRQREIKDALESELHSAEAQFEKYLLLKE